MLADTALHTKMLDTTLLGSCAIIRSNWHKNHRHHGGFVAAARCWWGTMRLERMAKISRAAGIHSGVDCFTCSVIPGLTSVWSVVMSAAIPEARFIVGDCSGGFAAAHTLPVKTTICPLINGHHGAKMDLMISRMSTAEFIVVSDDDVFWLDRAPWDWAMEQFHRDPKLAVVSMVPRERFQWTIQGRQYTPVGSYNLILRRDIWQREELDLRPRNTRCEEGPSHGGVYDTADYANVELLKRGYNVAIAPRELRQNHLVEFKGVSGGLLVAQKNPDRRRRENGHYDAAQLERCVAIARGLADIAAEIRGSSRQDFLPVELLDSVTEDADRRCSPDVLARVRQDVRTQLSFIRSALLCGVQKHSS